MAVLEVNDRTFMAEVRNSDVPVLVDFFATWCGPCQMLAPTIEELSEEWEGKYKVCKADVDKVPALVGQFRIMSVPTLVLIRDGREADRLVGGQSREQIAEAMARLG